MASGGRPPHSTPSLPLHSTTNSLDSLRTPDNSSLFLSSLGNQTGSRTNTDFTSLEDLLNFTGITNTSTPSLAVLAQDLEQKQGEYMSVFILLLCLWYNICIFHVAMGPPPAKRIRCDTIPSNIHITSLSSTIPTANNPPSSSNIPSLFPTTVVNTLPLPLTTSVPQSLTTAVLTTAVPLTTPIPQSLTTSAVLTTAIPQSLTTAVPQSLTTSVPQSLTTRSTLQSVVPLTTAQLNTTGQKLSSEKNHSLLTTNNMMSSNLQTSTSNVKTTPTSVTMETSNTSSLPTLPSNHSHRALLVQLVQAYKQCTALADTQGQARVRTQLNLLLQAQQRMEHTLNTPRSTPSYSVAMTTSSLPNVTTQHATNHTKPTNILMTTTSSHIAHSTPSHSTPSHITTSLPTITSKPPSTSVSMATNTLFSQAFGSSASDSSITTPTIKPLATPTVTPLPTNPTRGIIHTYIHTYIHTHIHTYIHVHTVCTMCVLCISLYHSSINIRSS